MPGRSGKRKSSARVKAGKKAAETTAKRRGPGHFQEIGRKGAKKANAPAKSRAELRRIQRSGR